MLQKGSIQKELHLHDELISKHFLVNKKGWKRVINLKNLTEFLLYQHFIVEDTFFEGRFVRGRLHVQDRSEGCLLYDPNQQGMQKCFRNDISNICLGRKPIRVPLPLFWFGACSPDIHKAFKIPNSSPSSFKTFVRYFFIFS